MSDLLVIGSGLLLGLLPVFLFPVYWSYHYPKPVTGRVRLARDGDQFYIEAEYRVLHIFRRWKPLGYWRPLALCPSTERNRLSPKFKGRFSAHRTAYYNNPDEAKEAAIDWQAHRKVEHKTHSHDGPKELLIT